MFPFMRVRGAYRHQLSQDAQAKADLSQAYFSVNGRAHKMSRGGRVSVKQHGHSERINESLDFKSVRFIIILLMLGHGLWLCVIVDAGEAGMNHLHQVNTYSIKS